MAIKIEPEYDVVIRPSCSRGIEVCFATYNEKAINALIDLSNGGGNFTVSLMEKGVYCVGFQENYKMMTVVKRIADYMGETFDFSVYCMFQANTRIPSREEFQLELDK